MTAYTYYLELGFDAVGHGEARDIAAAATQLIADGFAKAGARCVMLQDETLVENGQSLHIPTQDGLDRGYSAAPSETAAQPVVSS